MNPKRIAQTMLGIVQQWVEPALKAANDRVDEIEARLKALPAPQPGEKGEKGADADQEAIIAAVLAKVPPPTKGEPGKDAEPIHPDTLKRLIGEEVRAQVDAIPRPKDAEPVNLEWLKEVVTAAAQNAVNGLPKPADGKDADMVALRAYALECAQTAVATAITEIPPAQPGKDGTDGHDVTDDQVRAVATPLLERMVADIPRPENGTKGDPGEKGADADPALVTAAAENAVAKFLNEMTDELLRGFEDPSAINVQEQTVIAKSLAETLRETLMLPVKPVYDAQGRLLYGQRVAQVD